MKRKTIQEARKIAKEFIKIVDSLEKENNAKFELNNKSSMGMSTNDYNYYLNESIGYTRNSAKLKRVSMELTHLLADLRLNR